MLSQWLCMSIWVWVVHSFFCMLLGMVEFWASTTFKPDVPKPQVYEFVALHKAKVPHKEKVFKQLVDYVQFSTMAMSYYILRTIAWVRSMLFVLLCGSKFTLTIKRFIMIHTIHTLRRKPSRTNCRTRWKN